MLKKTRHFGLYQPEKDTAGDMWTQVMNLNVELIDMALHEQADRIAVLFAVYTALKAKIEKLEQTEKDRGV